MKLGFRVAIGAAGGIVLGVLGLGTWAGIENRPVEDSETAIFKVHAGESLGVTAQRLAQERLVRNPFLFRSIYRFVQGDGSFPSGTFSVPGNMTAWEAADFFRHAVPLQVRVTIPEGWTSTKIARLLEEKKVVAAEAFLSVVRNPSVLGDGATGLTSLEGRLFPDTYQFPLEAQPEEVARTLWETFQKKTAPWTSGLTDEELSKKIVLASIVEREYRAETEAPLIASVFANRLDRGIPLGSCATIEYILTEIQGRPHPKRIFFVHTKIPSPYNTYLNKGLPPAAIANPGLTALKAVLQPVESNYLYFVVADPQKGTHTFSSQFSQHERAREAYLTTFVTKG